MRIGDSSRDPLIPGRRNVRGSANASKSGESSSTGSSGAIQSGVPGAIITELLGQLRDVPTVREDVLAEVDSRLKSGELLTTKAADDTARQILSALASYDD